MNKINRKETSILRTFSNGLIFFPSQMLQSGCQHFYFFVRKFKIMAAP